MANENARRLRKTMTPQEVKLWVHLRGWRERGYHFRRQSPLGRYVLDFLCLKYKLVVELDGGQHAHPDHLIRDSDRDEYLSKRGFRVLRFWNTDVDQNLNGVLQTIDSALRDPHPIGLAADHPPPAGEG